MSIRLQAITPKLPLLNTAQIQQQGQQQLNRDCTTVINKIAQYPPQEPTNYVRSGQLGSNWKLEVKSPGEIWVVNRVTSTVSRYRTKKGKIVTRRHPPRNYAVYVQGSTSTDPGQARVMEAKGWNRIDDVADEVFLGQGGVYSKLLAGG